MFKSLVSQAILLLCLASSVYSADIDLQPLLASGGTVTLNPANTYYVSNEFSVPADTTIIGNGATITVYNGPVKGNSRCLILEDCNITGSGAWACVAFQNGGSGEIHGCTISCAGANAVYVADSSLKLYNTIIKDSQYGVNSVSTSSLELTNCSFRNCQMSYLQQKGTSTWINGVVEQSGGGRRSTSSIRLRSV